jgi:hypothetical protein
MRRILSLLVPILSLLIAASSCQPAQRAPLSAADSTLYRACHYLWQQQSEDGAWHSQTHALMRGGESMTPFVAWALFNVPDSIYDPGQEKKAKALDYLRQHINAEGIMGLGDPDIMEYPNYSTAYTLRVLRKFGTPSDQPMLTKMTSYLLAQQFTEHRGILPDHLAFGSWGFGEKLHKDSITGHVDLSVTRRVLEALPPSSNDETGGPAFSAQRFLSLLQKRPEETRLQPNHAGAVGLQPLYDGGFYYSPVATNGNKAKQEPADSTHAAYYRSYATATCDGILALLASGFTADEPPVKDALNWLERHPELDRPGGIPVDDPDEWHLVMKYYHLCVRSEALGAVDAPGTWRKDIPAIWVSEQLPDGSFSNPLGARNKEDDPMLATAFAVISLRICRER